eukprot:TRINITY_DN26272_c0_g4_i1.p2 TRINITY_DN26272_c0_g4~~TRINITY_DN26272_c0_g4_i1.p2  ORF type:complete len:119 (-),score=10.83 TRINITY_DN26272_c0_g4_i1:84-410(-)
MDPKFAEDLKKQCGTSNIDPKKLVNNDYKTPARFDNQYYKNLLAKRGLFTSDQSLVYNRQTMRAVKTYSKRRAIFLDNFKKSVTKMGMISPLTGTQGQVRRNCHWVNK